MNQLESKLSRLTLVREIYRNLLNHGRTYAAFEKNTISPLIDSLSDREEIFDPMSGYGTLTSMCAEKGIRTYCLEYILPSYLWQFLTSPSNTKIMANTVRRITAENHKWPKVSHRAEISDDWYPNESKEILTELYKLTFSIAQDIGMDKTHAEKTSLSVLLPFVGRLSCSVAGDIVNHVKKGGVCVYRGWHDDFKEYLTILNERITKIQNNSIQNDHNLYLADARTVDLKNMKFKAMITSPPYPNHIDYWSMFEPEHAFLDIIFDEYHMIMKRFDKYGIGSNFVKGRPEANVKSRTAKAFLNELASLKGSARAEYDNKVYYVPYLAIYFSELEKAYENLSQFLDSNFEGFIVCVNNTVRNKIIPVHKVIIEIWKRLGFNAEEYRSVEVFHVGSKNPRLKGLRAKHSEYVIKIWRRK